MAGGLNRVQLQPGSNGMEVVPVTILCLVVESSGFTGFLQG